MNTLRAAAMCEAAIAAGAKKMVFDWHKAARLIRESGATDASAGLKDDWEWTGGAILRDGRPLGEDESYTYLASLWAIPQLKINGQVHQCWIYVDAVPNGEEWGSGTRWPESALAILRDGDA